MNTSANFIYSIGKMMGAFSDTPMILIVDLDLGNKSVTNDVEAVLARIKTKEGIDLEDHVIAYRDSLMGWDMINVDRQGDFTGFAPLNTVHDMKHVVSAIPSAHWKL